jgi:hypothetical protein
VEHEAHRLQTEVPRHWADGVELLDWLELG